VIGRIRRSLGESLGAFRDVFGNPDLRRLELAWAATQLGRFAYFIAIAVYAFNQGGATAVGVVAVIRLLPGAMVPLKMVRAYFNSAGSYSTKGEVRDKGCAALSYGKKHMSPQWTQGKCRPRRSTAAALL